MTDTLTQIWNLTTAATRHAERIKHDPDTSFHDKERAQAQADPGASRVKLCPSCGELLKFKMGDMYQSYYTCTGDREHKWQGPRWD